MSSPQCVYYNTLQLNRNNDEIRILEVDKATCVDAEISGSLTCVSLRDIQRPFEALSYMWGPSTKKEKIRLAPDFVLDITDNLAAALRVLRGQGHPHRIWIDAVCINQNDVEEKNHQVKLMRRIYSAASLVVTWINLAIDGNKIAVQRLRSLTESSSQEALELTDGWESLVPLILDPYWNRLWIQQEISMAAAWKVQCINIEFSSYSFYHYFRLHAEKEIFWLMQWARFRPPVLLPLRFMTRHPTFRTSDRSTLGESDAGLNEILLATKRLDCTDDRDRLYGVMLLANNVTEGDIEVDYSTASTETFMEVPQYLIQCYQCLDFLPLAGLQVRLDGAQPTPPSWIPDLAVNAKNKFTNQPSLKRGCRHGLSLSKELRPAIVCSTQSIEAYGVNWRSLTRRGIL